MGGIDWSKKEKEQIAESDKSLAGKEEFCRCAETVLISSEGVPYRIPTPKFHSCHYIRRMSMEVPAAMTAASYSEPPNWQRAFAGAMNAARRRVVAEMDAEEAAKAAAEAEAFRLTVDAIGEE